MSLSVAQFRDRHTPTFNTTSEALIQQKLDEAARFLGSESANSILYDDALSLMAADLLAMEPSGQQSGLRVGTGANQRSVFANALDRVMTQRAANRIVLDDGTFPWVFP
jgi:hypothetical protein